MNTVRLLTCCTDCAGTAHPATKSVSIPPTNFTQTMATYHLAAARLPRDAQPTQMSWSNSGRGEASLDDESATGDEDENENGAGMGRIRLSLLKMGCMVNVDAPHAVSVLRSATHHRSVQLVRYLTISSTRSRILV